MFGFLIGTACLIGLAVVLGRGHRARRWQKYRFSPLHAALDRIDASPAQERSIIAVVDGLRDRARQARKELRRSLEDVSKTLRAPTFDRTALDATIAQHVETIRGVEQDAANALGDIYDLLDERQRARLADVIESGGPWHFYGHGHRC